MKKNDAYDLSTVHGRLTFKRAQKYPTATAAAVHNGWSVPTTAQHENGTRRLTIDFALKYAAEYGTTLDYLFLGKDAIPESGVTLNPLAIQAIPRLDLTDIEALAAFSRDKRGMSNRTIGVPPEGGNPQPGKIFVKMLDNSMESKIYDISIRVGDDIELDANAEYKSGDIVAAIISGLSAGVIRQYRLISINPHIFELKPHNRAFPTVVIDDPSKGRVIAQAMRRLTPL